MKTARFIFLIIGLGVLARGVSFAEPSAQGAPKAPAQKTDAGENHPGKDRKEDQSHGKTEAPGSGHSGDTQENHKTNPQPSKHPADKTDEKHSTVEKPMTHEAKTHPQTPASHGPNASRTSGISSGQKVGGNISHTVTPGNSMAQHPAGASKPASTVISGAITKKPANTPAQPAALSANKLPTSPTVNTGRSSTPVLATIGGPAKPGAGSTAAISGTAIRIRP